MRITVNGEEKEVEDGLTLAGLIEFLGLGGRRVAVEHNRDVIPAKDWAATALADRDALEIVHFVGGG